jgi:hypothetical protein
VTGPLDRLTDSDSDLDPDLDGGVDVVDFFDVYRCNPEATFPVSALDDGDPVLEIRVAAVGGGEVGAAYADNDWIYGVWLAGSLLCSGADLHSGGIALTHREIAVVLAEYLSESGAPASLLAHRDRLGLWADDDGRPERDGDV